ncbi:hypothetical protein [Microbacterium sp. SS28]|uniref:hypothetical protein n=1 Tax=Microbacterium sp. SS28 TaxID=2919948 RepID=UPI001FAA6611|nr:hypothetical protein [Microbacterium sp. SS28]
MTDTLARFVDDADVSEWTGLPAHSTMKLGIDHDDAFLFDGALGDPPTSTPWTSLPTRRFTDGLRVWLDDDRAILLEGAMPTADDGSFLGIPDLGPPDAALDFEFGPLLISHGELVYGSRGLAVCVNPRSGVLLALRGFGPTTADDYLRRLRPVSEPEMRRPAGRTP